ncbi:MAG: hypothetical protein K6G25_02485 [Bacteroidales bacterium]|nr:hypothetical protein [Bacteroidales bacterium]
MKNISKLAETLRELWKSGQIVCAPGDPIDMTPMIKEYLERLIREYMDRLPQVKKEVDARLEKIIATAVVKLSMEKMGMNKEEAMQAAREAVAFLRDVRAKKLLEEGKLTKEAYELYNRLIHSAWVIAAVKTGIKNTGKKVKEILSVLVTKIPYAGKIVTVIKFVASLIPEEVKQKAKAKAKEMLKEAAEKLPHVLDKMIQKGYKVAKKVKETITTGVQKAIEKGKVFVEKHPVVKAVVKGIKRTIEEIPLFGQLKERLKKFSFA